MNEVTPINIILCVPKSNQSGEERDSWEEKIKNFAENNKADLVIFPEGYIRDGSISCEFNIVAEVEKLSKKIGRAVLCGIETVEGYQTAVFYNPEPKEGETIKHIYIKHSSADRLAYQKPGYQGKNDPMFNPINFRKNKIGVMICHDMFFPLITHTLVNRGAEILVDLTGGNVRFQKWENIIKARSIEIKGIFLCTMGHNPDNGGYSSCFAYDNGRKIPFYYDGEQHFEGPRAPGFCLVKIPPDETDITISFNSDQRADLEIIETNNQLRISSNGEEQCLNEGWIRVKKGNETIGLLVLPLEKILDRVVILKKALCTQGINYYFVLYHDHGTKHKSLTSSEVLALAKLRAIENRVGILIYSAEMREVLKTTKYKDIQRFKEENGVFKLDKVSLGGPESTFTQGIPREFEDQYLELM